MKTNYNTYHTGVKTCFALGLQEQLLPQTFIESIPNSTSHYWKRENPDKYLGSDFVSQIEEGLDDTILFLDKRLAFGKISNHHHINWKRQLPKNNKS
jgi:hypothetical protein